MPWARRPRPRVARWSSSSWSTPAGGAVRRAWTLVATWSGAAREAYEQRQARWRTASQDLQAMLRDIKIAVDESAADYLNTERRNTQLFQ